MASQLMPAVSLQTTTTPHTTARLAYIDLLRAVIISVVIVHHAAQPYGPTGGEWPITNPTHAPILEPFFTVNAAFGLGLLFLMAGYFTPHAYDHKGAWRFLLDRLIRLGVPLLVVSLVLMPPFSYFASGTDQSFGAFLVGYMQAPLVVHMWFVAYLILYTGGYIGWRWLSQGTLPQPPQPTAPPGHATIFGFTLGLALATFVVRIWFPVDHWVQVMPFSRLEPAHMPQYLSLFVVGIVAYRHNWLEQLPRKTGMIWLAIGLAAAALVYAATILRISTIANFDLSVNGGLSFGALLTSIDEALIAVGLSIGLLTLFRERVNWQHGRLHDLATLSYAVYILHIFPVVGLQVALQAAAIGPLTKAGMVALLSVPLCYALAYGLRKVPLVARVV